jgi:hypothetical protein
MSGAQYRTFAEAALARAALAGTPEERADGLRLAAQWKRLAEAAERQAERDPLPEDKSE